MCTSVAALDCNEYQIEEKKKHAPFKMQRNESCLGPGQVLASSPLSLFSFYWFFILLLIRCCPLSNPNLIELNFAPL
ncbi:hypothetical protein RRG08_007757 [Elysia crispata]|uniref:Uncharacterized protein n=1 Tax=Elysia crispata TaxID=231223 RepID=A0AAE1B3J9_9GAST|nr:hypothetical protein RRG08_007757 [Elysia crispata]